jgi:hypothetical protein
METVKSTTSGASASAQIFWLGEAYLGRLQAFIPGEHYGFAVSTSGGDELQIEDAKRDLRARYGPMLKELAAL